MSDYYAFEMSPVPDPGPDAVPPELFRGIYGMPAFVTIPTDDLAASVDFWTRGLGFFELFGIPGRPRPSAPVGVPGRTLVTGASTPDTAPAISVSFACVLGQVDSLVEACRAVRPDSVDGPRDTAWNTRDVEVITPEHARSSSPRRSRTTRQARRLGTLRPSGITDPTAAAGATMWTMHDARDTEGLTVGQAGARSGRDGPARCTTGTRSAWRDPRCARPPEYRLYTAAGPGAAAPHRGVPRAGSRPGPDPPSWTTRPRTSPDALRAQRTQVAERIERLQRLGAGLDRMIDAHERGLLLTIEEQAAVFGPGWDPEGPVKARQSDGDTTQWQQFAERSARARPGGRQAVTDAMTDLDRALAEAMDAGVTPGSPAANELVERHRDVFAAHFPLTRQMQVCLGRKYEAVPGSPPTTTASAPASPPGSGASSMPAHAPTASTRNRDLGVVVGGGRASRPGSECAGQVVVGDVAVQAHALQQGVVVHAEARVVVGDHPASGTGSRPPFSPSLQSCAPSITYTPP